MSKEVIINNQSFKVNANEFNITGHKDFDYVQIVEGLGLFERIASLLSELSSLFVVKNLGLLTCTHGGFIPLKCSSSYDKIFIISDTEDENIKYNSEKLNVRNISYTNELGDFSSVLYVSDRSLLTPSTLQKISHLLPVLLGPRSNVLFSLYDDSVYNLKDTDIFLYVPPKVKYNFLDKFKYYIEPNNILNYDNLINLCIMVKDAGDEFENMLTQNFHLIDRYTILDTGSTDNTLEIIKRVLKNKKGDLYEEPFINFRESRNRCLDLAGTSCKYNLMLDDTYVIKGDLRKFLTEVRGDQYFSSFSLLIKGDDLEYTTCRLTKSENRLRYIYKMHEIIQHHNNISGLIPIFTGISIEDYKNKYMEERTMARKQYDLKMLLEMIEEEPNEPRHLYYTAQTYSILNESEKAAEYFLKRVEHPVKGENSEICDSFFEMARIHNFKLNSDWNLCESYYLKSWEFMPKKPDPLYFIGLHYFDTDKEKSFYWFKKALNCGYNPQETQHSIRPTVYFKFIPYFLSQLSYLFRDFKLGEHVSDIYLSSSWNSLTDDYYNTMVYWKKIFNLVNNYNSIPEKKPYFCIVADGGWDSWDGSDIYFKGVGGSETYIIETARNINLEEYTVIVFNNTQSIKSVEGVEYRPLSSYSSFIKHNKIKNVLISRYPEYLPLSYEAGDNIENIYICFHDIPIEGSIILTNNKLKKVFCMTKYHSELFKNYFPVIKNIIDVHGYGIDKPNINPIQKIKHKFIYSSFANRGLLPLLQMWPNIKNRYPDATLHIYTDITENSNGGKWVNRVYKEGIESIKALLKINKDVFYHGWVNKHVLYEAWSSSDIWLYPCIFNETFCLTAFEAAITKTFAITTNLGALKETVGDRGVLLDINDINDPMRPEWRLKTLPKIFSAIDDNDSRQKMIEANYEWVSKLSWKNKTIELLNKL